MSLWTIRELEARIEMLRRDIAVAREEILRREAQVRETERKGKEETDGKHTSLPCKM